MPQPAGCYRIDHTHDTDVVRSQTSETIRQLTLRRHVHQSWYTSRITLRVRRLRLPIDLVHRYAYVATVTTVAIVLAIITTCEPVIGDSWGHFAGAREAQPLTLLAHDYYAYGNPRWGQLLLTLAFRTRLIEIVVTPLVLTLFIVLAQIMVRGRLPRARSTEDAHDFILMTALVAVMTPQFGAVWFYKPVCMNYVYPHVVQLAWLLPYRLLLTRRPPVHAGLVCVPAVVLGLLGGAGNEHTGVALGLVALGAIVIAYRRDRSIPVWSVLGLLAHLAGMYYLLSAPGQLHRYRGMGNTGLFAPLVSRGLDGNARQVWASLAWTLPMVLLVGGFARAARYRLGPRVRLQVLVCIAVAAGLVCTIVISPKVAPRLFIAPATAIAVAVGCVAVDLITLRPRSGRYLRQTTLAITVLVLGIALAVQAVTGFEGRARRHAITTAARGTNVVVPAYTFASPTLFTRGDDFRSAQLRKRIAALYDLGSLEVR